MRDYKLKKVYYFKLVTIIFIFCFLHLIPNPLFLVPVCEAEETGAAFLKISPGTRQIGMGGAGIGLADDAAGAIYYNPAGMGNLTKHELEAVYTQWIDDLRYEFVGYIHPTRDIGNFGIGFMLLHMGEMERRGMNRERLEGTFSAYDLAITVSYGKQIDKPISVGSSIKFIQQKIEEETAFGIALDLGMLYSTAIEGLKFGITIQNIGPKMKFINEAYNLPLMIGTGLSYELLGSLTLAMDFVYQPLSQRMDLKTGIEYAGLNVIKFRIGYLGMLATPTSLQNIDSNRINQEIGNLTGIGFGIGFQWQGIGLDYSFSPFGLLGDAHRFAFLVKF